MNHLASLIIIGPTRLFPIALAVLTAVRLLNGQIATRGLLTDRETGRLSALSVQMLLATFIAAGTYAAAIAKTTGSTLPPINSRLLALVAGTNGLLLGDRALIRILRYLKITTQG